MTNTELIKLLQSFPPHMEVHMEVKGVISFPTDVDMENGGSSAWLTITDYPVHDNDRTQTPVS